MQLSMALIAGQSAIARRWNKPSSWPPHSKHGQPRRAGAAEVDGEFNVLQIARAVIATTGARVAELEAALRAARKLIGEIDEYQKRPERGDYGVECACCMGELLDDDHDVIATIARALNR